MPMKNFRRSARGQANEKIRWLERNTTMSPSSASSSGGGGGVGSDGGVRPARVPIWRGVLFELPGPQRPDQHAVFAHPESELQPGERLVPKLDPLTSRSQPAVVGR